MKSKPFQKYYFGNVSKNGACYCSLEQQENFYKHFSIVSADRRFYFPTLMCKSCKLLYIEKIATFSAVNQLNLERILKSQSKRVAQVEGYYSVAFLET